MANAISTYTIGSDLRYDPDFLFDATSFVAVGDSPVLSSTYLAGLTDVGLEIVGKVDTAITVEDTKVMTLSLEYSTTSTFTSATSVAVYTVTGGTGGTVLSADQELFRYAPNTTQDVFWRARLISTQVTASGTFSIFPVKIG